MKIKSVGNVVKGAKTFMRLPSFADVTSVADSCSGVETVFDMSAPNLLERVGLPSHAKEQDVIDVLEGLAVANFETEKERCDFVRNSRLKDLWGHRPHMFAFVVYQVVRESYSYRRK